MLIVGIVGGIASGKSVVAAEFQRHGAVVLDADRTGHQVLELPNVKRQVREKWNDQVFDEDGSINRKSLASIVFAKGNEADLADLEKITHGLIRKELEDQVTRLQESGQCSIAILDAPVMFKSGWNNFCDQIVFVDADDAARQQRAVTRGWTADQWKQREASQLSLDLKKSKSDWIIENNGDLEQLQANATKVWNSLIQLNESKEKAHDNSAASSQTANNSTANNSTANNSTPSG